ncbi:hypothetical protein AVEN_28724-1 [Araneus ventricosus]|uniref:Uncharacterized protein n=1 Tax=Araneus ventricosus TaxID=182803 RepID=A0A4Y2MRW5_ARAVE|nr:hypothetical protein AVEN_28724-1 [Araneus ventricosus]
MIRLWSRRTRCRCRLPVTTKTTQQFGCVKESLMMPDESSKGLANAVIAQPEQSKGLASAVIAQPEGRELEGRHPLSDSCS